MFGIGNVTVSPIMASAGSVIIGARNGVSLDATNRVVLGNDVGGVTAALISNREVPMAGFSIAFTGIGATVTGIPIFRADATRVLTTPIFQIQDSTSTSILDFRVPDNNSIYIGFEAGLSNPSINQQSIAIGRGALRNTTGTSIRNIAIGQQAMQNNVNTATLCVAIGSFALFNVTGSADIAIGHNSGVNLRAGSSNVSIGVASLGKNQTGGNNVAIGDSALGETLVATTNTSQNVAIGAGCYQQNNPGNNNVGIGYHNCFNTVAGDNNVTIGSNSFVNNATLGAGNVLIGGTQSVNAGGSLGASNIFVGANILTVTAGQTNTTLIGQGMSSTLSNLVVLGRGDQNVILGSTATAATNGAKLQVIGDITTNQPSASGQGKWLLGKVLAGVVALDAANFIEVQIDGAIVKLLKAA